MHGVEMKRIQVTPTGLVTRRGAAEALGCTSKTLSEWAAKGRGPKFRKIGGRVFYAWQEVLDFASGQT